MATTITANGINFPDGSAGTPSIGGSDTNTGLFTGSDVIGFATGGLERLKIDASGNVNIANDSGKLQLGASNDLQIYHESGQTYIQNSTGNFRIDADALRLRSKTGSEAFLSANVNGAVELYYDNSKKFETSSSGATVTGSLTTGGFTSTTAGDALFTGTTSGRNAKWDTSHNRLIFDDNALAVFGSGADLQIFHNGSQSKILDSTGNELRINANTIRFRSSADDETYANFIDDGAVELYHNGSKKFESTSYGALVTGTLSAGSGNFDVTDNGKFKAGNSSDLQIYHDGNNNVIQATESGQSLFIKNDYEIQFLSASNEKQLVSKTNGAVELYHNNSKKLETTSGGVNVTGSAHITGQDTLANTSLQLSFASSEGHIKVKKTNASTAANLGFHTTDTSGNTNKVMNLIHDGTVVVGGNGSSESFSSITLSPDHDDGAGRITFNRANTSNVSIVVSMKNASSEAGRIEHDNTSCGIFSSSDYRLKENVVPISDGITRVKTLKPYRFNFKTNANKTVDGFFAHEVTAVPESVSGTKDQVDSDNNPVYQAIDQSKLVPLLVAALQEAIGRIEALEAA